MNPTAFYACKLWRGNVFLTPVKELISKADVLLEALPYLQRYRGKTFVIKYGGSFMDSPDAVAREGVARDIVFLAAAGIRPIVVHGGGKAITRAMEEAGLKATFVQGMRVTDEATASVVERVLSHEINPEIVATINRLAGKAAGFSGTAIFKSRKLWIETGGEKFDAGFLGEVASVRVEKMLECLSAGTTPVCSPTALGDDGRIYNCNADVAAAQMAIALKAGRLIFMSDVPGVLRDPTDPSSVIPYLRVAEVEPLKKSGIIDKGMIPKADSAVKALRAGVDKVSFVDGRVPHSILLEIFTKEGLGTELMP
ncbi:MAG TPA: acetylglutamate kinase [Verrucomicrobiae bacterium]|nr:acetylglutamate kinase [Verrucomicrobiae bacterium]